MLLCGRRRSQPHLRYIKEFACNEWGNPRRTSGCPGGGSKRTPPNTSLKSYFLKHLAWDRNNDIGDYLSRVLFEWPNRACPAVRKHMQAVDKSALCVKGASRERGCQMSNYASYCTSKRLTTIYSCNAYFLYSAYVKNKSQKSSEISFRRKFLGARIQVWLTIFESVNEECSVVPFIDKIYTGQNAVLIGKSLMRLQPDQNILHMITSAGTGFDDKAWRLIWNCVRLRLQ